MPKGASSNLFELCQGRGCPGELRPTRLGGCDLGSSLLFIGAAQRRGSMDTTLPKRKLRVPEAAHFLGLSKSTLDKLRLTGGGPAYLRLGRRVVYDPQDLDEWVVSRKRVSTSGPSPIREATMAVPQLIGSSKQESRKSSSLFCIDDDQLGRPQAKRVRRKQASPTSCNQGGTSKKQRVPADAAVRANNTRCISQK
jgi:predicted DNA-binding transcriptional regulator AlpA